MTTSWYRDKAEECVRNAAQVTGKAREALEEQARHWKEIADIAEADDVAIQIKRR
jgi:hypothetical protein